MTGERKHSGSYTLEAISAASSTGPCGDRDDDRVMATGSSRHRKIFSLNFSHRDPGSHFKIRFS